MITIRQANFNDIDALMLLFEEGKKIMRKSGNLKQWTGGYPQTDIVWNDITNGHCYVCQNEWKRMIGTFAFISGQDPTYTHIYQGQWLENTLPYATIHRLASTEDSHGVAKACLDWCYRQIPNLRADTHRDNLILQHILEKHGFHYCGIIYLANGDERLAYQKIDGKLITP